MSANEQIARLSGTLIRYETVVKMALAAFDRGNPINARNLLFQLSDLTDESHSQKISESMTRVLAASTRMVEAFDAWLRGGEEQPYSDARAAHREAVMAFLRVAYRGSS